MHHHVLTHMYMYNGHTTWTCTLLQYQHTILYVTLEDQLPYLGCSDILYHFSQSLHKSLQRRSLTTGVWLVNTDRGHSPGETYGNMISHSTVNTLYMYMYGNVIMLVLYCIILTDKLLTQK